MAHRASDLPAGFDSQPYDPVPTSPDPSLRENEKAFVSATTAPVASNRPRSFHQLWSAGLVGLTATISLVALIAWLGITKGNSHIFDTFAGERIGGRLTQAEAKAIDVIAGAFLAPLFMASVNHIWFSSARVSAVNEEQTKAVSLRTLVAASNTSAGNYDLFHLRDLLQGKTWRLFLLAALTLLSAMSRTALSNIIAYEAFSEIGSAEVSATLRLQTDDAVNMNRDKYIEDKLQLYEFDASQNAEVAKNMMALLTDLTYEDAASRLTDKSYVGINATSHSLDSLPQVIVELKNVPAYRLSVNCTPDLPISISAKRHPGLDSTQILLLFNTTATSNDTLFVANYAGVAGNIQTGDADLLTYAAFPIGDMEVYLGHLVRSERGNRTYPSSYGDIRYRAFNMTQWGFYGTQAIMSVRGLRCILYRERGLINSTRISSNETNAGSWDITSANFPAVQEKVIIFSFLSKFGWHAPGSSMPGLGHVLMTNGEKVGFADMYDNFALNFLYASGEAQRIMYEVAASSTNASRQHPEYFTDVPALATQELYRITYVPSILLMGLLCLLGASMVTGAMAVRSRNSVSSRKHRQVNVARLLIDSVVGLQGHKHDMARVSQKGNTELEAWAAQYKVRYTSVDDGEGTIQIVLEKT